MREYRCMHCGSSESPHYVRDAIGDIGSPGLWMDTSGWFCAECGEDVDPPPYDDYLDVQGEYDGPIPND